MKAPLPHGEIKRLEVLRSYHILDTPPEQEFDDLTRLAAQICGTPISAVTLIDQDRQWLKSKVGLQASETPRDVAFCAHAILRHEPLIVSDATADARFADNPLVIDDPNIRFYAGVPLETIEGQNIGTLCVIDTVPRDLEPSQLEALRILAVQVIALIERRRAMTEVLESQSFLSSTLDALSSHIAVLDENGIILAVNRAWHEFAAQNQSTDDTAFIGTNYIEVCQSARGPEAKEAGEAAAGIRAVIAGTLPDFSLEYACHTSSQQRWFNLTVARFAEDNPVRVTVAHENITKRKLAEQRLQHQAHLLNVVGQAVIVTDKSGVINYWNDYAEQLYGWSATEAVGRNIVDVMPTDVTKNQAAEIMECLMRGESWEGEFLARKRDGTEFPIHATNTPVLDEAGNVESIIGISLDITERRRAEGKLRQSEIQFRAVFDNALDAIVITDNEGRFLEANEAACEIYGTERVQLLTMKMSDFIEADRNSPEMMQDFRASFAAKGEFPIVLPDGSRKYMEFASTADFLPDRHLTALRDVTERKATSEAIGRLAAIVQSSNDAIIGKTLDGIITSWNNGAQILYGYSAEEAIGRHASFLLAENRPDEGTQLLAGITRGERIANYETVRVRKDGSTIDVALTFSPVTNEADEVIGASVIARDITERKQAETALRASEQRFRAFMDNTPTRVFIKDREGRYVYLNKAIEQFRKTPFSELQGQTAYHNFPLSIAEPVHRNDLKVFNSGQPQQFEELIVSPDGEVHYEIVSKFILPDTDGYQLLAGIAVDVTEQRKAEQQRDRFFSLSLDMLCISGFDGYLQRVNPAFTLALGHIEKELMTIPFVNFVHPDDVAATEEALQKLVGGGVLVGFENRYRHKDGTWHWLEWKAIAESNEGLIYAAAHDITERKAAQAALLEMRDDLEARVEERTRELVQINARLTGEILDRERAERLVRAQARQQEVVAELGQCALAGTEIETLFSGGIALISVMLEADVCSILELLPDEESLLIRAGVGLPADAVGHEIISALPDTAAGHALSSGKPVIVEDLREESRFTPASLDLAQEVSSSVNVMIPGADKPFGLICCGSTQGRIFNRDDIHFLQAVANVLSVAITRASVEQEIVQLNTQLQASNEQLHVENIEHQATMDVLRTTAESLQAATAEANAANLAKSEFLSRMSHELRTPLNAILGFGQILERKKLDELAQESLGYILKGGRHLLDLINEILDISRVESGHVDLSLEPIALRDIMPDACALVRPLAKARAIHLKENWALLNGAHVLADHQRLKQVLLNLFSNAIKYNREGGEVEVICQQNVEGRILIAVRDTGPGIAPQDLSKLFTPFERLDAANSNVEGTGLGLVLSERLVTAMNGTLSVESTLGQGTTFTVELPQATAPLEMLTQSARQIATVEPTQTSEQTYTVLCIEDNPSNLHLVESILQGRPEIILLTAIQGSLGIDLARQHEPDLILLDLNLPDIHGSEVLARLQASAVTREIPVVVVSADATSKQIEKLMAAGAEAYLTKPLNVDQFLQTIDNFLTTETKTALSSDDALDETEKLS